MGCCGVVGTTRFMAVMGILYSAAGKYLTHNYLIIPNN